jgi:Domain of unknown function (DUF4832)
VEVGVLGYWGEWHCVGDYGPCALAPDGSYPPEFDETLVGSIRHHLPDTPILVRRPEVWRRARGRSVARVGLFNDCFLTGPGDVGTYSSQGERQQFPAELKGSRAAFGGETCEDGQPTRYALRGGDTIWSTWNEMQQFGVSYLNAGYGPSATAEWKRRSAPDLGGPGLGQASDVIAAHLGYRLVVRSSTTSSSLRAGEKTRLAVVLRNEGFAPPMRQRQFLLVLARAGEKPRPVPSSPRATTDDLVSGQDIEVIFDDIEVPGDARPGDELRLVTSLPRSQLDDRMAFQDRICAVADVRGPSLEDCKTHDRTNRLGVLVP